MILKGEIEGLNWKLAYSYMLMEVLKGFPDKRPGKKMPLF